MAVKKTSTAKKAASAKPVEEKRRPTTKSQTLAYIAEETGLSRTQVGDVLDALNRLVARDLDPKAGIGNYTIPGLAKIRVVRKEATEARKGRNPFTGEEIEIKAKPAHNTVRISPVKALKEMV
jgi:nucleoid DNA-binding protein